ncbi:MAG: hypothetical protein KAJ19_18830, partial [Gammaproteobacteria bacterium]|nr:hypothetical protein [Gammaproteobacteria bacterium]
MGGGDVIYLRGGVYQEIDIDIPQSKDGTCNDLDCTGGSWSTLKSYPGEWAKIDATGLNTGSEYRYQHVIRHPTSYATGSMSSATKYWKFERFEITGGRNAFWLTGGPMVFRYLYIHHNGRDIGDDLVGGLFIFTATENLVEYNFFEDNEIQGNPSGNNANILFDADYRDTSGNGEAFQPDACVKKNIIRYNYIKGSPQGIRLKGDQRFGYNDRDPRRSNTNFWRYKDYGDEVHHNIILDSDNPVVYGQDFVQIYNNIATSRISASKFEDGTPILYNACVYNNLVKGTSSAFWIRGAGNNPSYSNYYDGVNGLGTHETHPHTWLYNNIASGGGSGWHEQPFIIVWDIPSNEGSSTTWDMSDVVLENNFIHESSQSGRITFLVGHNYEGYSGCDYQYKTTSEFNTCSAIWRSVGNVTNWENDNSGLFLGTSGADQYKTRGEHILEGSTTIANGGIGGPHPYLAGVTIPSYVGPCPDDACTWVDDVLALENLGGGYTPPNPVCGNGSCDSGETCSSCSLDCGCISPEICCSSQCVSPPSCPDCNDQDSCTIDTCTGQGTCYPSCQNSPLTSCINDDNCCPSGCDSNNDNDCSSQGGTVTETWGDSIGSDHPGTVQDTYINAGEPTQNFATDANINTYTWPVNTAANAIIIKW